MQQCILSDTYIHILSCVLHSDFRGGVSADRDREMRCMRILHMAIAARRSIVPKFLVPLLKCIGPRRVSHFHSCLSKVEKCQVVRWLAK